MAIHNVMIHVIAMNYLKIATSLLAIRNMAIHNVMIYFIAIYCLKIVTYLLGPYSQSLFTNRKPQSVVSENLVATGNPYSRDTAGASATSKPLLRLLKSFMQTTIRKFFKRKKIKNKKIYTTLFKRMLHSIPLYYDPNPI